MLDREKIMLKLPPLVVVDTQYSRCDCNNTSYCLRIKFAEHCFNNLVYNISWTSKWTLDDLLGKNRSFSHFMQLFIGQYWC